MSPVVSEILLSGYIINSTLCRGLFSEIETLLDATEVTPAEIAEELMKSEDAEVSLQCVVKLLKRKKLEEEENGNGEEEEGKVRAAKRLKVLAKVAGMVTRRKFFRG